MLKHIKNSSSLIVPTPLSTSNNEYLVKCEHDEIPSPRYCDMFNWISGKIKWRSIDENYSYKIGSLVGQLQRNGQSVKIKHRNYWNADGLVGTDKAKFYNIEKLTGISKREQGIITSARRFTYKILSNFEKNNKDRIGLVHGDIQPNNIVSINNDYAIIDFDDCGVGFYGDDLATMLFAYEFLTENEKHKNFDRLKEALYEGYSKHMPFSQKDADLIPYLLLARKLSVVGWLELRKDNPRLRCYFKESVVRAIKFYEKLKRNKHKV